MYKDKRIELLNALSEDYFVTQFIRDFLRLGGEGVHTPKYALGFQRMTAHRLLSDLDWTDSVIAQSRTTDRDEMAVNTARAIIAAATYFWSLKVIRMLDLDSIPPHIVSREQLPYRATFHIFERPVLIKRSEDDYTYMDAYLLADWDDGCYRVIIGGNETSALRVSVDRPLEYGLPYSGHGGAQDTLTLAMLGFLNSKFIHFSRVSQDRAERRRIEKSGALQSDVNIVTLRALENIPSTSSSSGEHGRYKHRFMIRGHFRAQWYASTQAHKIIWIAPFIKGPEGAPFLEKVYGVVR